MEAIQFYSEDTDFQLLEVEQIEQWLCACATNEQQEIGAISVIFCSDNYLLEINRKYLQHDYFTDIITFDYTEDQRLSGDLFISVETVRANAAELGIPFAEELQRVMIHGVLHLSGYTDKDTEAQKIMRSKEDFYLAKR